MAASHTISLTILTVAAFCCLLPFQKFPSAAAADLATQVCQKTTDFNFCRSTVYSDPRAAGADRFVLIDVVFRIAYSSASDTRNLIVGEIRSGRGKGNGVRKCLVDYDKSVRTLELMLNDLNSESYYDLDKRSLDVQHNLADCGNGLRGPSPIAQKNQNMLKIANICYVVSKLF